MPPDIIHQGHMFSILLSYCYYLEKLGSVINSTRRNTGPARPKYEYCHTCKFYILKFKKIYIFVYYKAFVLAFNTSFFY